MVYIPFLVFLGILEDTQAYSIGPDYPRLWSYKPTYILHIDIQSLLFTLAFDLT